MATRIGGLQNIGLAGKYKEQLVELNPRQVATCFDILDYCVVRRSLEALCNQVFQRLTISRSHIGEDGSETTLPMTSVQASIVDRYWTPWARTVTAWLVAVGVCPYYMVPLGDIIGRSPDAAASSLEATAVWGQRVPAVPTWREGSIRTGRNRGKATGHQVFTWTWRDGEEDRRNIRWITEPTGTPCPVTGSLNSILSALIPEWENLILLSKRLDTIEDLRAMPALIIRQDAQVLTTYNDRYGGDGAGGLRGLDGPVAAGLTGAAAIERQLQTQIAQEESMRRAAEYAYRRMHDVSRSFDADTSAAADEAWEYQKERRVLLPAGCHLERTPETGGLTREQFDLAVVRFEQHATSMIGFPTEMWGQSGSIRPQNPTYSRIGFDIGSIQDKIVASRKAQFTEIIQAAFIYANRDLLESEFASLSMRLPRSARPIWPELWGRMMVHVELGPAPNATIEELVFARDQRIIRDSTMRRLARYILGVTDEDDEPEDDGKSSIQAPAPYIPNPPKLVAPPPKRSRNRPDAEPEEREATFEVAKVPKLPKVAGGKKKAKTGV